jgi:hypothetical protein
VRHLHRVSIPQDVSRADLVPAGPKSRGSGVTPRRLGLGIGAGRTAIGLGFLAAPLASVRVLGLDTATAHRLTWLARMTAVRDLVIGAGTLASVGRGPGAGGWLLAGAAADATDAVILTGALRAGQVSGLATRAIAAGAVVAAGGAVWAAVASATPHTSKRS